MTDTLIERLRIPMDTELRKFEEVYDEERSEAADRIEAMQEALERIAKDDCMNPWGYAQNTLDTLLDQKQ